VQIFLKIAPVYCNSRRPRPPNPLPLSPTVPPPPTKPLLQPLFSVSSNFLSVQDGVLVPESAHHRLHGGAIGAALGQHLLPVCGVLAVEASHEEHANDSDTGIILEGGHEVLDLAPRAHDDLLELPDLRLGHVGSLQGTLAPFVDSAYLLEVLPGEG